MMSEASEKLSGCSARLLFLEWFELSLEEAVRIVEDAASSFRDMEVMLESFIERVMLRVEARLGENEETLRALECRLKAEEDGLKCSKLPGQGRVKPRLKSFAASLTHFSNGTLFSSQIDVETCLKENEARLRSIEAKIKENEACEDRMFHACLENAANSGFSYRSSMFEHRETSLNADPDACDPVLETCFVNSVHYLSGNQPYRSELITMNDKETENQEEAEETLGI
ncbi:MAG TPA: hypothetical protein VJ574_02395 [Candidatus Bathyarchaeia archaeon]|nr:hypothetical protein [Candidatus Bathyarchaeia archaeon]